MSNKNIMFLQYLSVLCGTFIMAISVVCFLSPNGLITGGGTGISLILHYLFNSMTLGTLLFCISVPFIILGYIYFGKFYTIKTFFALFMTSFFIDLFREVLKIKPFTNDILLGAIFGGLFLGLGVGLVIKGRSSTGSTSVLGDIAALKTRYKTAEVLLVLDVAIMIAYILTYQDITKALYSTLGVYITAKTVDRILTGRPSRKIIHIVSNNVESLSKEIRERIEEHGTIIMGEGLHHGQQKTVIMLCVDAAKIQLLKDIIEEFDPEAFLIIAEAAEFFGRD